ncbi:MAG: adenosylmethionine--8-amino-7-oxononanoate transaminase [Firmicutes bacterium]|nr:adenosylmethionine--8-amino-7-oxononanoate transaminase [Bacillota bacterium]
MNELQAKDLKYIWHPCSQMKDYEDFPPIVIERGAGAYLYDTSGKAYLDAVSSWWVNLFGHNNPRLNEAIRRQLESLEHVIFANFSHKPAIELAERIIELAPKGLKKVFFADNGSSAIEVALKLSFQYHQQTGRPEKTKFLSISGAYHGETLGALSTSGIDLYSKIYHPILMNSYQVQGPDCFRCSFGQRREDCNAECFEWMEKKVEAVARELSGIIIEPLIQAAAGMKIYSPVYLKKLRELCGRYNIHFIADEIAVGFGRTGKMFACEHAETSPDIMCLSKGLTAGYLPLSLTLVTDEIYEAFYADYIEQKAFLHSHSYTGNPVSCAVACESLNIFAADQILEKNRVKSQYIREIAGPLAQRHPFAGEYRQLGMVGALELVADKKTKEPFDWRLRVGYNIYRIALEKGVLLRPLGNVIYFMPPYVVAPKDIEFMVNTAFEAINQYFGIA